MEEQIMTQGEINANCVRLDTKDTQPELKEYASTLTDDQKKKARAHIITYRKIGEFRRNRYV
jgi:hypothetical protein